MKNVLLALCLLTFAHANSQNWVDLANVFWRVSPANSIDGSTEKSNMNMYVANAKLPLVVNDNNIVIIGLEYEYTQITSTSSLYWNKEFASSMLQIGLEHKWNDKSKMLFLAIPRFNTDYSNVDGSHFQIGGLALGTSKRSENFDWKYGLYYNGELFGPMIVPIFGFNWKINEKLRLKLAAPLNFEFAYMPSDRLRTGIRFDGVNASYRVTSPGGWPRYIDKADNNVWAFGEFHFGKNIWFHIKAGYSIIRKYRYFNENDKMTVKFGPVNVGDNRNWSAPKNIPIAFKNGLSLEARFIYRLPI